MKLRIFAISVILLMVASNCWAGWLTGWSKRKAQTITGVAAAQTDYSIKLTIHYGEGTDTATDVYCNSAGKVDFSDLRFTTADETTLLSHWIESKTDSDNAVVWVKVPSIGATPATVGIYLYYGNATAASTSNISSTFLYGQDAETPFGRGFLNAASKLSIPTYTGSPAYQAIHPGQVIFDTPWHGYKYWMAFTPYPNSTDAAENPSIVASADGITYEVPAGITNPLLAQPSGGYNADPDMFYNTATDELWMTYKRTAASSGTWQLVAIKSADGVAWTTMDGTPISAVNFGTVVIDWGADEETSQSIQIIDSVYHMWSILRTVTPRVIKHRTSADFVTWSAATDCTTAFTPAAATFSPYHGHVQYIPAKSKYVAMMTNGNAANNALFIAESTDGVAFTFSPTPAIDIIAGWDSSFIYRPWFTYDAATDALRVWYSAKGADGTWGIGYTSSTYATAFAESATPGGWFVEGYSTTPLRIRFRDSIVQTYAGNASAEIKMNGQLLKALTVKDNIRAAARIYDNASTRQTLLQFSNAAKNNRIGIGILHSTSATSPVYNNNTTFTAIAAVSREAGWRKYEISAIGTSYHFFIDEVDVANVTGGYSSPEYLRLNNDTSNDGYVDNMYVRKYVATEPAITANGTEENAPQSSPPLRRGMIFKYGGFKIKKFGF